MLRDLFVQAKEKSPEENLRNPWNNSALKDATVEQDDQKAAHERFPAAFEEQICSLAPAN